MYKGVPWKPSINKPRKVHKRRNFQLIIDDGMEIYLFIFCGIIPRQYNYHAIS
jgi:hypothetical protein